MMSSPEFNSTAELPSLPKALTQRSFVGWLSLFGPGAVVASVTIGTGELIFSTRGGVLFGYNILFLFIFISLLKWVLVFGTSKHLLLTGVHPFRRMLDLPGPRGWMALMFLMIFLVAQPVWISFHSSVLGNYLALLTGTTESLNGAAQFLWAIVMIGGVLSLSLFGGYNVMEIVQIGVVDGLMVAAVTSMVMYNPNYFEILKGFVTPIFGEYPDWISTKPEFKEIAATNKWVELTTYVGVIGGAGFDYMAYTTWLRDKRWGYAGSNAPSLELLEEIANDPNHNARKWLKAPVVDCAISFALIIIFSAVFVTSGVEMLAPEEAIPDSGDMPGQQAGILTNVHPWVYPLYLAGAVLTMFGTLYGTFEIGVAIVMEIMRSFNPAWANSNRPKIERNVLFWQTCLALVVVLMMFQVVYSAGVAEGDNAKSIILKVLRPVNLFTGVISCSVFCFVNAWIEEKYVHHKLRSKGIIRLAYLFAGIVFAVLGAMGAWMNHRVGEGFLVTRWFSIGGLIAVVACSILLANKFRAWVESKQS
ncbi:MAG: Nramp family divalent metal transporter [Pirellulales bacterium]|nr:Nramp family divalent metal transporter [Pirellulales bacterium]